MSATPAEASTAAPKKSRKLLLIVIAALLVLGGGGGGYFFLSKGAGAATKEKPEKTKKAKAEKADKEKEDEEAADEEEAPKKGHDEEEAADTKSKKSDEISLPDDSQVKHVIELQPFIVNLADKGEARYLRLTVNVGVGAAEGGEEKADPLFTTRVRNAMLAVLSSKTSDEILTTEGKNKLRKDLLRAARKASEEPEIHAIYITDFIVQL